MMTRTFSTMRKTLSSKQRQKAFRVLDTCTESGICFMLAIRFSNRMNADSNMTAERNMARMINQSVI